MIQDTSSQDTVIKKQPFMATGKAKVVLSVVAVIAVIGIASMVQPALQRWSETSLAIDASRLRVGKVTRGEFTRDVSVQGSIVAANRPMLYSPQNGRATLNVRAGDQVSEGALLASIESPELLSNHQQEQATLSSLKTELARQKIEKQMAQLALEEALMLKKMDLIAAKRELKRAEISWQKKIISRQDYDRAIDEKDRAEAIYQHNEKAHKLKSTKLDLELEVLAHQLERQQLLVKELERKVEALNIRSPVNGVVGNLEIQQKAIVTRDQPLLSVIDMTAFEAESLVPEIYADELALGMAVEIGYSANLYQGEVSAISPEIKNGQVAARVRFTGQKPDNLRQNLRVTTRIIFDSRQDVLVVSNGPFMQEGNRGFAYLIKDGVAQKTPVRFGSIGVGLVEVISGAPEGAQIVLSASDVFQGHDKVLLNNTSAIY